MRKLIFSFVLISLFAACENAFEPNVNNNDQQNPFIITYDEIKEETVQSEWNKFLIQYKATPDTIHTHFMKSTSFITQAYFKDNLPKIFPDSNTTDLTIKLLSFYAEWENLFGCKVNNIELEDSNNNESETFIVRFQQLQMGNSFSKFIHQPFIQFRFTKKMELKSIISTLIPFIEIEIPQNSNWVNISKMTDNTMGFEYEFTPDASSVSFPRNHLFSATDKFHVKDGFEIYPKYSENTLSIYYLKGIEYFWTENDIEYKCTIYYHPSTAEIIYIKKW